ncbi:hypothetical protein [Mesorhizobium sp. M0138]|uniref:hypothetical protein n=1 Tax=Mesorhizobium sp. M0138 TaxID=2956891 RepID=UPI0033385DD3
MNRNDLLTFDGITQSINEWALDYGIRTELIIARLKRGAEVERAITLPMRATPGERLPEMTWPSQPRAAEAARVASVLVPVSVDNEH